MRTVRRWQKEGGEARSVTRSTNAWAFRERVQEQGLDVGACRVIVLAYNEERARRRTIGPQHIAGTSEGLIDALDALEDGDTTAAAEAFGDAWLGTYGIGVDVSRT